VPAEVADKEQSRLFFEKAQEIGADEEQLEADLMRQFGQHPPRQKAGLA
jgi:hypothetical protein